VFEEEEEEEEEDEAEEEEEEEEEADEQEERGAKGEERDVVEAIVVVGRKDLVVTYPGSKLLQEILFSSLFLRFC